MAKEYWYFLCGVLVVVIPLAIVVAVKKFNLLDVRPDVTLAYSQHGEQPLQLHGFHAKNPQGNQPAPALLFFHGGGWLYGSPRDLYPQCQFLATQGISCFSAQYRLGANGRADIPGAVADARDAFDFLLNNAAQLRIDPARIAVGGGSAGGQLAAALGAGLPDTSANEQRPYALALYNPILDLAPEQPNHYLVRDDWQAVSPYQHIDVDTPPALILVGSHDVEVPVTTVQRFCDAMLDAGSQCDMEVYEGQGHGFFNIPKYLDATNQRVLTFMRSVNER